MLEQYEVQCLDHAVTGQLQTTLTQALLVIVSQVNLYNCRSWNSCIQPDVDPKLFETSTYPHSTIQLYPFSCLATTLQYEEPSRRFCTLLSSSTL